MEENDDLRTVARLILAEGTSREEETLGGLVSGLMVAGRRLEAALSPILGSLGVRMIMTRAVQRTATHYPFIDEVIAYEDGIDASGVLLRKLERDYELDYSKAQLGFEELLVAFCRLLAELVGKDLAMRLVEEATEGSMGSADGGQDREDPGSPYPGYPPPDSG